MLKRDYGRDQAEVIMNICGNIVSGQVLGETAKQLSERLGKIMQERESVSINSNDTSVSRSTQLESALQPSRISSLSSGEFVGAVADNPDEKIPYKAFHCEIQNDIEGIQKEESTYEQLPIIRNIDNDTILQNYYQIKRDIRTLIDSEMKKIENHPDYKKMMGKKKGTSPPPESL